MSELTFFYAAMNAGKSSALLQSAWNYRALGMHVMMFGSKIHLPGTGDLIVSRIGISAPALSYGSKDNLFNRVQREHRRKRVACVFVDEAQFLRSAQVWQLGEVVDQLRIPVQCYGLRTDFRGRLFEGAGELLAIADRLVEIGTICHCGKKATMVVRCDTKGRVLIAGEQIGIDKSAYQSLCRAHWVAALRSSSPRSAQTLPLKPSTAVGDRGRSTGIGSRQRAK